MKRLLIGIIKRILDNSNSLGFNRNIYYLLSRYVLKDNQIRHFLPSIIYSKDDFKTTPELVRLLSDSSKLASQRILNCGKKNIPDSKYLNIYPGEHYRLLNAIVETLNVKNIVVGEDFRFGYNREGNVNLLKKYQKTHTHRISQKEPNFAQGHPPLELD